MSAPARVDRFESDIEPRLCALMGADDIDVADFAREKQKVLRDIEDGLPLKEYADELIHLMLMYERWHMGLCPYCARDLNTPGERHHGAFVDETVCGDCVGRLFGPYTGAPIEGPENL
jgi:hypothetical protein